jgi:hypothetical protein
MASGGAAGLLVDGRAPCEGERDRAVSAQLEGVARGGLLQVPETGDLAGLGFGALFCRHHRRLGFGRLVGQHIDHGRFGGRGLQHQGIGKLLGFLVKAGQALGVIGERGAGLPIFGLGQRAGADQGECKTVEWFHGRKKWA